jgi:hypothetical protein
MAYGTVKTKALIYESGGSDVTFNYKNVIQNGDSFSGGIIQGQVISGATGVFTSLVSGALISATTLATPVISGVSGVFTSLLSGTLVTGNALNASNITGNSISGTTFNCPTGDINNLITTGTVSGIAVTGNTGALGTLNAVSGTFTSTLSGNSYKASGNVTVITGSGDIKPYGILSFPAQVGASGQLLTSNGDGSSTWKTQGDVYSVEVVSGTITGQAGKTYVVVSGTTLTLPAAPATGAFLSVINRSNATTGTIARNGENIMGLAEDMALNSITSSIDFIYYGGSQGWVFI